MFETLRMVLAGIGASAIICALLFVTILIGILVNAMIVLMAGPIVDRFVSDETSSAS